MGYLSPGLTETGLEMMAAAMNGTGFTFTKIVLGNGSGPGDDSQATAVTNPKKEIGISGYEQGENYVVLTVRFDNSQIGSGFYMNELGVYARQDGSETEQLYAYRHTSTQADYVPGNDSGRITEVVMRIIVAIGEADNVQAVLIDADIYADKQDFEYHIHDYNNPHRVTKGDVGLGNVENLAFLDNVIDFNLSESISQLIRGETIRAALGKIARLIAELAAHLAASNPHNITPSKIGAAPATHNHSASQITSGTLPVERGGTGVATLAALKSKVARKITYVNATMTASGWSGSTYSFESSYKNDKYNIEVSLSNTATRVQQVAYSMAKMTGNKTTNVVTALGVVPSVNIPVILMLVEVV